MKNEKEGLWRYICIGGIFLVFCAFYIVMFINLQVSGQDYYSMMPESRKNVRTVKIQAQRGEIFDRNGEALVSNKYSYDLRLDYGALPASNKEKNNAILTLANAITEKMGKDALIQPAYIPINSTVTEGGGITFSYNTEFFEQYASKVKKYNKLAQELNIPEDAQANEAALVFMIRYGITDKEGMLKCSAADASFLLNYRLDLELEDFSADNPYTLAKDISFDTIAAFSEENIRGFSIYQRCERVYEYPGYASHILGRINKIPSDQSEYYTELGYPLDAIVGVSGAEYAFEEYLHGTDGELRITEDEYGNVTDVEVIREPVAGHDVWLTLDIGMQMAAEKALAENIEYVHEKAENDPTPLRGEDAKAGALSAVDPSNGEVLALASYPTYDLSTFSEDYALLSADETSPLLNRALNGHYEPGSTFKPGIAAAALNEGVITEWTEIEDKGVYTYYDSYQPECWIHLMYGSNHGSINVTKAIQESCNYFFYDVGRQLTIERMNRYCRGYGYGEPTGIELGEFKGTLASPNTKNDWTPGDTLQAAIGQSVNNFSPLQMSVALSTIINGGVRYSAHLLYKVNSYGGETVYEREPEVVSTTEISEESRIVVLNAMKDVIEGGSVSEMFADYPIAVGGKTGTAQISDSKSDNAIFTAFAPFDSPELAVACVIEQGNTGANAGFAIKKLFDYYFDVGGDGGKTAEPESTGGEA